MVSDKLLSKMPRSNKKKGFLKSLAKIPVQSVLPPNNAISELMASERKLMISRAISSARNHGISLEPGSQNPGTGDCAFQAVIQNNNDRTCFGKNFLYQ